MLICLIYLEQETSFEFARSVFLSILHNPEWGSRIRKVGGEDGGAVSSIQFNIKSLFKIKSNIEGKISIRISSNKNKEKE